jgi:hypothetical protein
MKTRKLTMMVMAVMLVLTWTPITYAAVSPEDAAKLGATLTGVGAEMAGNKDGTIPPYTGGLTKLPANYKPGSGVRPDPFAGEKPLFSINAQNMTQYADKLTEGTKALMRKYSSFRVDVYKTHRTAAFPDFVIKNTMKNALKATTADGGLSMVGARAGVAFPIPKDGYEAMWNHLTRFLGRSNDVKYSSYNVDANGRIILTEICKMFEELPFYDEDASRFDNKTYLKVRNVWSGPARKAGEAAYLFDPIDMYGSPRVVYQYLPGQRRIKLAPEIGYDTPSGATGGNSVYDETWMLNGPMDRYTWKLIGKKELYVPYNTYKATYLGKKEELFGPKHLNPDVVRWELHRMWVVEATLRPGKRHVYPKRMFYLDEDSWNALACENYDAHGTLFKANFGFMAPNYDVPAPASRFSVLYNLIAGNYVGTIWLGEGGYDRKTQVAPERDWAPSTLVSFSSR